MKYVVTHRVPHIRVPKLNPSKTPSGKRLSPHTGSGAARCQRGRSAERGALSTQESSLRVNHKLRLGAGSQSTQNMPRPLASLTKLYGTFWPTSSLSVSTVANAAVSATP